MRPHAPNTPRSGKYKVLTHSVRLDEQSAVVVHVALQSATASLMHRVEPSTMPAQPHVPPQTAEHDVQTPLEHAGVEVTPHRQVIVLPQPSALCPQTFPRLAQVSGVHGWQVPFLHCRSPQHDPVTSVPQASPC